MNSKNSNPKFTGERHIFHYTFLFDAYTKTGNIGAPARYSIRGVIDTSAQGIIVSSNPLPGICCFRMAAMRFPTKWCDIFVIFYIEKEL